MPEISQRAELMPASPIRKLVPLAEAARARGTKIYHLNIGQPDLPSPQTGLDALKKIDRTVLEYSPSDGYRSLREKLVGYYEQFQIKLSPDDIIVTTGGSEAVLFAFMSCLNPGDEIIVPEPAYANYMAFAISAGAVIRPVVSSIEQGFALPDVAEFEKLINDRTRGILICNPNNPTGNLIAPSLLWQIWEKCWEKGILLVVDECFLSFLPRPWEHTLKKEVQEGAPLLLLRAFTKLYAMAGIRLGYCLCGDRQLLARMAGVGQPWGVSVLAQQAGLAALREDRYVENVRALIGKERPWLWQQLERAGVHVVGGSVNYLFFRSDVPQLGEKMRHLGVMIRSCANYPGLSEGWYRVAVRTREENQRLAECIRQAGEGDR